MSVSYEPKYFTIGLQLSSKIPVWTYFHLSNQNILLCDVSVSIRLRCCNAVWTSRYVSEEHTAAIFRAAV